MENSCRKKYKPSPKKWILASRYTGFRRNPALIPANAGLFHYAGNNPVRYIDPSGQFEIDSHNPNRIFANLDDADDLMNASAYLQTPNSGYTVTAYGENSGITKNFTTYGEILQYANFQYNPNDKNNQIEENGYSRGVNITIGVVEILGGIVVVGGSIIGAGTIDVATGGAATIASGWAVLGGWGSGSTLVAFGITRLTNSNNAKVSDDIKMVFIPSVVDIAQELDKATKEEEHE